MAKKSLMAEATESAVAVAPPPRGEIAVPDIFAAPVAPTAIVIPATSATTPYMVFAEPKSTNVWGMLQTFNPNVGEGAPVLVLPAPKSPLFLNPFRLFLVTHMQYWADMDDQNNMLGASLTERRDGGFNERNECVVIVDTGDDMHAANLSCTSVKSGLIHKISTVAAVANTPQWGEISDAHKVTLQIPDYRYRFVTTVKINKRIGKGSKRPYFPADGICSPIDEPTYARAKAFWLDEGKRGMLKNVADVFHRRVAAINECVGGTK